MANPKRIYPAGPEVFFPAEEHQAIVAGKKRLLREAGGQLFIAERPGKHRFSRRSCFGGVLRRLPVRGPEGK